MGATRKIVRTSTFALLAIALLPCLFSVEATEEAISAALRDFLERNVELKEREIQSVVAGRPLAKLLKTETKEEIAIFGIVRIHVPQEFFIEKLRNIIEFESGSGIHSAGLLHSPPC